MSLDGAAVRLDDLAVSRDVRSVHPCARSHEAGLERLFAPRGIAVLGASRTSSKLGAAMARALGGFPGAVALVNARDPDPDRGVYGSAVAAARACDVPLDLAVLCVPAGACAEALDEAADAGVGAAVVCAGGFAETGPQGAGFSDELLAVARHRGVRVLGPNTSGFLVPSRRLTATFLPGASSVPSGGIAVVAASGGVNHALAFLLADAGLGVSLAVGVGNGIDVTAVDVLDHLRHDPATRAVALHVESVGDGRALCAAVAALTPQVPVVALVVGRQDVADFAQSHTGALATSWRTTRAALRQAGAVLVDDEVALVHAVSALSAVRLPAAVRAAAAFGAPQAGSPVTAGAAGPGVAVVTAQAGPGLLLLDALRGTGVPVPELAQATRQELAALLPPMTFQRNPVDTGRPGEGFSAVLRSVAADSAVALLAVYALTEPDALDLPAAVAAAGLPPDVPLLVGLGGPHQEVAAVRDALRRQGVPSFSGPSALAAAVRAVLNDRHGPGAPVTRRPLAVSLPAADRLDEDQAKTLLAGSLAVATPERRRCRGRAQARDALAALPLPLAVKVLDPSVRHKSEVGGVHLGVRTVAELETALDVIDAIDVGSTGSPDDGDYLLESMVGAGLDLIVGARRDPVFGPLVLLGLGGTAAEVLDDVAVRLAPLDAAEAAGMAEELAARRLLDGWRGGPTVDREALAGLLCRLGDLLVGTARLSEVEINPLRVTPESMVALDAVVLLEPEVAGGRQH